MAEAPPITLEDFAHITAQLSAGVSRERVLAQAGIDDEAWLRAQEAWLARMAKQATAGDRALHERFLERLDEHVRSEEQKPKEPPKMALPLPPAARRALARARAERKPTAPKVAPRIVIPAAMKAEPDLSRTMAFAMPAPASAVLPFVKDDSDPAEETLDAEPRRLPKALPFEADEQVPTSTLDPESNQGPALPFRGGTSKARKDPSNAGLPFRKPKTEDPLANTVTGDAIPTVKPALPFSGAAPPPRRDKPALDTGLPFRKSPPADLSTATTMLNPEELAAALGKGPTKEAPDPLARTIAVAQAREEPRLTLEQFASLTAEVALAPQDQGVLERRYGLGNGGLAREKTAWALRFVENPKLSAEYARKIREYRTWLQKRR